MKNLPILVFVLCTLSACRTTVNTMKQDADRIQSIDNERGYLLLGVETNSDLKSIDIDGPSSIRLTHADLKKGTSYILFPLKAGQYEIENIQYNYFYNNRFSDKEAWQFDIKPATISYVGHLEVSTKGFFVFYSSVELVNRSTEALNFMQNDFPSILNNRTLYYGGPGEDKFFEFVEGLGE